MVFPPGGASLPRHSRSSQSFHTSFRSKYSYSWCCRIRHLVVSQLRRFIASSRIFARKGRRQHRKVLQSIVSGKGGPGFAKLGSKVGSRKHPANHTFTDLEKRGKLFFQLFGQTQASLLPPGGSPRKGQPPTKGLANPPKPPSPLP